MATAPVSRRLNLTRDQLAAFLTDQQQIRQFELLFSTVDTLQVIVGTDFEFQADNASATANEALAQINALAQVVDLNGRAEALSYLAEISKQIQALESAPPFSAPPAVTPASPTTSVQFNNGGAFGGASTFTYDSGTNTVSFGNITGSATSMTIQPKAITSGNAGTLELLTRNGASTNSNGGDLTLTLGSGLGTGVGGNFSLATGNVASDNGAIFVINGATPGFGGSVISGSGYSSTGASGDFTFYLGGGATDDGNLYFQDSGGSNFIHCKTATPAGAQQIGFFNAAPVIQPAPTASGTGNVLSSVVTALNSLGLVDSATLTDAAANFTDVAQGLVPASGGGTSNFLRADGTFAAPTATVTPAGADTQIQYNNAGALGASANFTFNSTTNTVTLGATTGTATYTTRAPTTATIIPSTLVIAAQNNIRTSGTSGVGGAVTIQAGNGRPTGAGATGGAININSGLGGIASGNGGAINITAGNSTLATNLGGKLTLRSGNGAGMDAIAGDNSTGNGGGFLFRSGAGGGVGSAGDGGAFQFLGGQAVGTSGNGGTFFMAGGGAAAGGGNGGSCVFTSGFSGNAAFPSGDIRFSIPSGNLPGSIYFQSSVNLALEITHNAGTSATEIGFFNVAPVAQPTTATGSATFVVNSGGTIHPTSTFDGYTLAQVVRALRDLGILA